MGLCTGSAGRGRIACCSCLGLLGPAVVAREVLPSEGQTVVGIAAVRMVQIGVASSIDRTEAIEG